MGRNEPLQQYTSSFATATRSITRAVEPEPKQFWMAGAKAKII